MYLEPGYTGPKRVRPSELKYCHGTISNTFADGTPLEKTFEDLAYGRLRVQDLPPLETMYYPFGGILCVTNGNRRLFVLQKLESFGVIAEISVMVREFDAELFKSKNLSLCNGSYVKVRDDNNMEQKMREIWENRSCFVDYARFIEDLPSRLPEGKTSFRIYPLLLVVIGCVILYFSIGSEYFTPPQSSGMFY